MPHARCSVLRCLAARRLAVVMAAALFAAADCGGKTAPAPETPAGAPHAEAKFLVGFSNSSLNHPWRVAINDAIVREAMKYPDIRLVTTEAKEKSDKQIADIEDLIAQGIDLLLVCTVKGETFGPAIKKLQDARIPFIPVDRNILTDEYACYVGQSNLDIGRQVADYVATELTRKYGEPRGKAVEICGVAGDVPSTERKEGFWKRVQEAYPGIEILASQHTDYTRGQSRAVMENLLEAHPVIDVVYTHEDEIALGAIRALKAAGRLDGVIVCGNGGSGAALKSIQRGEMTACASYSPVDAGTIGMRVASKMLHGEPVSRVVRLTGTIITRENVEQFLRPEMGDADYVYTVDLEGTGIPAP